MSEHQRLTKKVSPSFKSVKLLNRPLKGKGNNHDELDSVRPEELSSPNKPISPIKGLLKPRQKNTSTIQDSNIKPPPSDIGIFNIGQASGNVAISSSANLPEALLAEAIKNNRVKLPGYLDLPGKLSKNLDKGIAGLTPGVSTDSGRIHDNLDRLKNEFCRFIDFKYHASTIGNTDLEQRIFLRNSFEKLKEVDYPTIKMQQWNEYQNLLLEQKKNLLLFQKSRGGDQPLDDAWCQTDDHSFDEFVNNQIKLRFDKLKEIKMKRLSLKRRLYLKGYFDITDFDDIEQIYDDKMLIRLGLDNQFVNDSSEDELDDMMDFVEKIDSDGRIEYNNYQIRQILSVYDKKFKRRCKPDYYQFFFGYLDYEKEKKDKRLGLYKLRESERTPKELKLKLVDFLDKKLSWTEIETPWEWERDFAIDEISPLKRGSPKIRLSDMDSSLVKKGIPNEFLQELTEIRKEYRRELLDNSLRKFEMEGTSRNISDNLSINRELMKNEMYGSERNNHYKEFINKLKEESDYCETNLPSKFKNDYTLKNKLTNRVKFKNEPEVFNQKNFDEQKYKIIIEREENNSGFNINEIGLSNSHDTKVDSHQSNMDPDLTSKLEDEILINLNKLILTKGISDELKNDLVKHLEKILQETNRNIPYLESCIIKKEFTDQSKNLSGNKVSQTKIKPIINHSKHLNGLINVTASRIQERNKNLDELINGKDANPINTTMQSEQKRVKSNMDIDSIEQNLNILRSAAGILQVLSEVEEESNLINNHDKLKKIVSEKVENNEFDLEISEIKIIEDGVEALIREILDKRKIGKQKPKSETRELGQME
ncbi:putative low complexity [Cryptosporidium sp. chipmunk genotype I]|uniref:putative low complexity n=1 Tax=Cryptosporidium sp. chipmunk genotype I TaxID=1280935 RepID=UPI00351A09D1|nr:putative low complexity [Cryptosporidium sp. chipmunk genotype I]